MVDKIKSGEVLKKQEYKVSDFSPHLFWDVERSSIDLITSKKWLIHRVLEYGLLQDWEIIRTTYGIKEIGHIASTFRQLDERAMTFIAQLSDTPISTFRCYTTRQSRPTQGNF